MCTSSSCDVYLEQLFALQQRHHDQTEHEQQREDDDSCRDVVAADVTQELAVSHQVLHRTLIVVGWQLQFNHMTSRITYGFIIFVSNYGRGRKTSGRRDGNYMISELFQ